MPAFVPNRHWSDPDHTATVRGTDVFLTRVPDVEDEGSDPDHAAAVRSDVSRLNDRSEANPIHRLTTVAILE